jgi:hypothetical protein
MADLAQVLLLPPPAPPPQRLPARDQQELAINADPQQGGDSARARRFRFRVYEGGNSGETGTDYATRGTGAQAALAGGNGETGAADAGTDSGAGTRYAYNRQFGYAASSPFIAQSIAQEHLSDGLHNPPTAAGTAAYGRTGAALNPPASAGVDITA